jgi:predicted GH43/DUF377 family glycosyl hydrolase
MNLIKEVMMKYLFVIFFLFIKIEFIAQTELTEYHSNPVFNIGTVGSWDAATVFDACILQIEDTLKMWYMGNNAATLSLKIGYAWSVDGVNWTRYEQPVLEPRPGNWDSNGVGSPEVILDGDTLKMWYVNVTPSGPGKDIGYATSVDGINWDRLDAPVLQGGNSAEWDGSFLLGAGSIIKEDNIYKMWYLGGNGTFPNPAVIQTGMATSTDGINWMKYDDPSTANPPFQLSDPVLKVGTPGSFDDIRALGDGVLLTESGYEMWYTGEKDSPRIQAIGYATSTDGIEWQKYEQNPVLSSSGNWAYEFTAPSVIKDSSQYRMWFTGFSSGPVGRIGYATSSFTTGIDESNEQDLNFDYRLFQNYPNPFNPTTKIKWQSPVGSHQTLKVYDLLGREVAVLINEEKSIGVHTVTFDASSLPSEVFIYQLQAGDYVESKKLIFLK